MRLPDLHPVLAQLTKQMATSVESDDKDEGAWNALLSAPLSRSLLSSPLFLSSLRQAAASNRIFRLLNALVARVLPTVRHLLEVHLRNAAKDPDGLLPPTPPDIKASHESAHNHPGVVLLERQIRMLQRQVDILKGVPPHKVDMRTGRA